MPEIDRFMKQFFGFLFVWPTRNADFRAVSRENKNLRLPFVESELAADAALSILA